MNLPVYLDHHSTTPLDPRVLESMMPYLTERFGNASSTDHTYGADASAGVEESRLKIAKAIGARPEDIVFTSGATESDNMALIGTMNHYADRGDHMITCVAEHKAVLDAARYLESIGKKVTHIPVDSEGNIDLGQLEAAITEQTVLISIMAANNEIGTIHDIASIGKLAHDRGVIFHTDAAQAVGHIDMNVEDMNIDLMSLSAHKLYGPKGVGALYTRGIRPRVRPSPIMFGGGQERSLRSGTHNVSGIVGFARALEIAILEMHHENEQFAAWSKLVRSELGKYGAVNGTLQNRLQHNVNMRFDGIEGKAVINSISKEVAISAGSACTTQVTEPSHVLLSIGLSEEQAHTSIRLGFGRFNTSDEIDFAIDKISSTITMLEKIRA